ncbi:MAG: ferrous iron transporter B [Thiohalomonadaceae bacterium]
MNPAPAAVVPVPRNLFRGAQRLRIALIGMPNCGKSTLFDAVASTSIQTGELTGTDRDYRECAVQIGLDEARVVELPSIRSLHLHGDDERGALQYLLWGDEPPPIAAHEAQRAPFSPPDVIIQVVDATALERDLELTLELSQLGRPVVIALNMMDSAGRKGLHISPRTLSRALGMPVVPTVALMGHGIAEVFARAVEAVRQQACPIAQPCSRHIQESLRPLGQVLSRPDVQQAFGVPHPFLLTQIALGQGYFVEEMRQHFPDLLPVIAQLRSAAEHQLPRPLAEELHADRHYQAATLFESATRLGAPHEGHGWRYWLDELFLHPQWGLLGSLAVFAAVLFVVFEVSAWLDGLTAARLIELAEGWQPHSTAGVVARAIADGLIGLVGIVVPYMIPLVMLLIALEQAGVMQRIAFVVDRGFHHVGLHGSVAVPFLLGLGCNVPALSAVATSTRGRARVVASVLITFVPCSARSAIILALAGKYLGAGGVLAIFLLTVTVIAVVGRLLASRQPETGPGQVLEIPPYALPELRSLLKTTWARTEDILTIVTPLLVGGSVVLALLSHFGADAIINFLLTPITSWWLGLPVVLGLPILFGVLRKELSLLMIYQALGSFEVSEMLDTVQITVFLLFLTFYVPCVSTFAVMLKTIGRKEALASIGISVGVALLVAGVVRLLLESARWLL